MTYVKMIDEETGRELTEEDLKNYEWVETTVHSTALDTRTYIRGRQLPAPYMQHADPAPPTEQEVLRYFGVLGSEIIRPRSGTGRREQAMKHDTLKCRDCLYRETQLVYKRRPYQVETSIIVQARCGARKSANLIHQAGPDFDRKYDREMPGGFYVDRFLETFGCLKNCPLIPGNPEKYPDVALCPDCQTRLHSKMRFCPHCGRPTDASTTTPLTKEEKAQRNLDAWIERHPKEDLDWYLDGLVLEGETFDQYVARHVSRTAGYVKRDAAMWMASVRKDYDQGGMSWNSSVVRWLLTLKDPRLQGTVLYAKLKRPGEGE